MILQYGLDTTVIQIDCVAVGVKTDMDKNDTREHGRFKFSNVENLTENYF